MKIGCWRLTDAPGVQLFGAPIRRFGLLCRTMWPSKGACISQFSICRAEIRFLALVEPPGRHLRQLVGPRAQFRLSARRSFSCWCIFRGRPAWHPPVRVRFSRVLELCSAASRRSSMSSSATISAAVAASTFLARTYPSPGSGRSESVPAVRSPLNGPLSGSDRGLESNPILLEDPFDVLCDSPSRRPRDQACELRWRPRRTSSESSGQQVRP